MAKSQQERGSHATAGPAAPALPADPSGRRLLAGRFRPIRLLGEGAMGRVYEADDLLVGDRVAVKRLRRAWLPDGEAVERCRREVQAARSISHPNVCRVFDLVVDEDADGAGEVLLVMEVVRGETLAARLARRGRLPPEEVLAIARQLCAAVGAAHSAGVVHRDLKPANVLLEGGPDGERVVVTDFGLARCLRGSRATLTTAGDLVGSPAYTAPEQVRGEPVGPAADLFALGIVLYEMLTGALPFEGETAVETALARLHGPPPSPGRLATGIDPRWDRVVLRCLALDPVARFARAGEVLAELSCAPEADGLEPGFDGRAYLTRAALLASLLLAGGWAVGHRVDGAPEAAERGLAAAPAPAAAAARDGTATDPSRFDEAAALLRSGELERAAEAYGELLAGGRETGDRETVVRALTGLGIIRARSHDLVQAERLEREALRLARQLGDPVRVASLLNNLGVVVVRQGRLPEAEKFYREAASLYAGTGDARRQAAALGNLGSLLWRQGYLDEAEEVHRRSLALRRAEDDRRGEAITLLGLGRVAASRGEPAVARERYAEALERFRRDGWPDGEAETLLARAEVALADGDEEEARRAVDRALAISREHGYAKWEAEASRVLALAALESGRAAQAAHLARESLLSFDERFDHEGRARAGVVLAQALVAGGQAAEARELLARLRASAWVREERSLRLSAAVASGLAEGAAGGDPRAVRERVDAAAREAARFGLGEVERRARLELAAWEVSAPPRGGRATPVLTALGIDP